MVSTRNGYCFRTRVASRRALSNDSFTNFAGEYLDDETSHGKSETRSRIYRLGAIEECDLRYDVLRFDVVISVAIRRLDS